MVYYFSFFLFALHVVGVNLFMNSLFEGFIFSFSFSFWGGVDFDFVFIFDWLSLCFSSFVMLISSVVFLYSGMYLMGDSTFLRYLVILIFFVLSMLILTFSPNFFSVMLGWDGLGVVSFLLVIYYGNFSSLRSGLITILTNRVGDMTMIFSFFFLFYLGGWMNFSFLFDVSWFLSFLIIFSAMTKSAQLPFSAWLPAAMAAPTPISSLVHSSTLVTAGVYLLIRFYYVISYYLNSWLFSVFSIMTMFYSGMLAFFEMDMKSVVAMSTLSQLGMMMFSISLGEWLFGYFHMLCHALFKSLLFLSCGGFILFSFGGQDLRSSGGFVFSTPFFFSIFVFSSLSLCGFPFLTGFFSKDLILESSLGGGVGMFFYLVFYFSCLLSFVYSLRLFLFGLFLYMNMSTYVGYFLYKLGFISLFALSLWSISLGYILSMFILLESYSVVFGIMKSFTSLVFLLGYLLYTVFIYFGFVGGVKEMFSDLFYMFWFSGNFSSSVKKTGVVFLFDLTWMEMMGPKGLSEWLGSVGRFMSLVDYYFYKMIFLILGLVFSLVFFSI